MTRLWILILSLTVQGCFFFQSDRKKSADEEGMASENSIYPALRRCGFMHAVPDCSLASLPKDLKFITSMNNGEDLRGVLFSPEAVLDPQTLMDLYLTASCLTNGNFAEWKWERTLFSRSEMNLSKLTRTSWVESRFLDTSLRFSNFQESSLNEVFMESSCLAGTNWRSSRFTSVQIENSIAERGDFSFLMSDGFFKFMQGNLVEAEFQNAMFNGPVDFKDTDMRKANLTGAVFKDTVNWEGAQLSGAIWMDGRVCAEGSVGSCN
jgi:uncharacterized protein YjbI with pentapeptide repeats